MMRPGSENGNGNELIRRPRRMRSGGDRPVSTIFAADLDTITDKRPPNATVAAKLPKTF